MGEGRRGVNQWEKGFSDKTMNCFILADIHRQIEIRFGRSPFNYFFKNVPKLGPLLWFQNGPLGGLPFLDSTEKHHLSSTIVKKLGERFEGIFHSRIHLEQELGIK